MQDIATEKNRLRRQLLQRRAAIPSKLRSEKSIQIIEKLKTLPCVLRAKSVFCYLSYKSEVETRGIIEFFLERNSIITIPKIVDDITMVTIPFIGWEQLQTDYMGLRTSCSNNILEMMFDITITPGAGFSKKAERIGYGKGYYDRWFSKQQTKKRIGIGFDEQIVEKLPVEHTDQLMNVVVTESHIFSPES